MTIMTTTKQALDQLSDDIEVLITEWETRNGVEVTDIQLNRLDVSNHLGEKSIPKVRCRAEISSR